MTTGKQIEALKLALEALDGWRKGFPDLWGDIDEYAVDAIREALAEQPEQQQAGEPITQTFTGLPGRKLRDLLSAGWWVNGVCFQRTEEDGTVRRGAITTGGMVLWWNQPAQQQEPEPVAVYVGETWCGSVVRLYEELPLETPLYTSPQPAQQQEPNK